MSTVTAAANFPIASTGPWGASHSTQPYTGDAYSGTFIPAVWSGKFNAKFYATSTFADVANTDWEGEIKNMGDKVIIHTAPSVVSRDYEVGANLQYDVPEPNTQELNIDRGQYFAFQVNDVLAYQAQPDLIDVFSTDAMEQMRIAIDSQCWYATFQGADAANKGSAAGANSTAYGLGTDGTPVTLTALNVMQKILEMASVLDEQNVPSSDRWLVLDPKTRTLLLQSELAQAYYTGDAKSPVRNGLIGEIDRFRVYVTNQLPKLHKGTAHDGMGGGPGSGALNDDAYWESGDGTEDAIGSDTANDGRIIIAGHKSALTFASQFTKTEQVRNPNDFGDYVRSLNVFGVKVVNPVALTTLIVK